MLTTLLSAGLCGIDGFLVTVECDAQERLGEFEIVGLPDAAVKEAKDRVRTASYNSGYRFPSLSLTVNLAPANRKKEGSGFDVAILGEFCGARESLTGAVIFLAFALWVSFLFPAAFAPCAARFRCAWRHAMRVLRKFLCLLKTQRRRQPWQA
jgi:hypothetical protein